MLLSKKFYYMRHGETEYNKKNLIQGVLDIPLNKDGILQARLHRDCLAQKGIQTICHSPLKRASETAQILNEVLNCRLVSIDPLKELNFGLAAGLPKNETWIQRWQAGEDLPEAEHRSEFILRALLGFQEALSYPGPVLIVAHGFTYWAIGQAVNKNLSYHIGNCEPLLHHCNADGSWIIESLKQDVKKMT